MIYSGRLTGLIFCRVQFLGHTSPLDFNPSTTCNDLANICWCRAVGRVGAKFSTKAYRCLSDRFHLLTLRPAFLMVSSKETHSETPAPAASPDSPGSDLRSIFTWLAWNARVSNFSGRVKYLVSMLMTDLPSNHVDIPKFYLQTP
jgi:hypothetical protein